MPLYRISCIRIPQCSCYVLCTKQRLFNATDLLKQWDNRSGMQKNISHYFSNKATDEFITSLISEEKLSSRNPVYVKSKASKGDNADT